MCESQEGVLVSKGDEHIDTQIQSLPGISNVLAVVMWQRMIKWLKNNQWPVHRG